MIDAGKMKTSDERTRDGGEKRRTGGMSKRGKDTWRSWRCRERNRKYNLQSSKLTGRNRMHNNDQVINVNTRSRTRAASSLGGTGCTIMIR